MNGLSGFGQQLGNPADIPQVNGYMNGFADHDPFESSVPNDVDSESDLIDGISGMLSSLDVKDFDNTKKPSLSSLGGGNSIWSDTSMFSPVFSSSNGSNNVTYGWGPPGSKVTSPQPWSDAQTMKSTTFQDITGALVSVSTATKNFKPAHYVKVCETMS